MCETQFSWVQFAYRKTWRDVSIRTLFAVAMGVTHLRFWIPDIEWGGCSCSSVSVLVLSIV